MKQRKGSHRNQDNTGVRLPPQSVEAEQAVLGGLMLSPESIDRVIDLINEDDFYRRDHRLIYRAIRALNEKNQPYDAVTLGEWFEANGLTEQLGNPSYLIELVSTTPSAANIKAYAEIVADKASLRRLIEVSEQNTSDGFAPDGRDAGEIIALAEQRIFRIAESGKKGRQVAVPITGALKDAFRILQDRYEAGGNITGLSTGFVDLDEITSGLQPTDLIILAARPAMGKSSLMSAFGECAAIRQKKAVAIYSMEMSASQLAFRFISSIGRINATRLRNGQLEDEDWAKVNVAIRTLGGCKLFIDDTPSLSPEELRSRARRLKREHDIGLILIDYLQLMTVPGSRENRATEISEISRGLKALAKELNVPVVALSQLNRGLEGRTDKRPVMSDLRESGAIEQDADLIMFIYRDEYYNKDSEDKGLAEVIVAKQRNGPTGTIKLKFFGEYTTFANLGRDPSGTFE